jgi:hypothetical protein
MREREAIIHWKNLIVTEENHETKVCWNKGMQIDGRNIFMSPM